MKHKIVCRLSILMGITNSNIQAIKDYTGLDRNTISGLKNNTVKRIDYDTMVKLCEFFIFNKIQCTPGDLFELIEIKEEDQ